MLKTNLQDLGINPRIIRQFLIDNVKFTAELNDDLLADVDPVTYQRNVLMIAQIELLILYLE